MKRIRFVHSVINWQPSRKIGLTLGSALRRVVWLRDNGPTYNWINTALYFARFVERLHNRQGWKGVVIYLKACHVILSQAVAKNPSSDLLSLGVRVKLSRQHIPLVIPINHRRAIMSKDKWTIKIWSTFFWLYRVIDIPGKVKLNSITKPFEVNYLLIVAWINWLTKFVPVLVRVIFPGDPRTDAMHSGKTVDLEWSRINRMLERSHGNMSSFITYAVSTARFVFQSRRQIVAEAGEDWIKFGPKAKIWSEPMIKDLVPEAVPLFTSGPNSQKGADEAPGPTTRTSMGCILTDWLVWKGSGLLAYTQKMCLGQVKFITTLISHAIEAIGEIDGDPRIANTQESRFTRTLVRKGGVGTDTPLPGFSQGWGLGKLAFIPEAAGKVRVVAMVDYLSQMLLRPLHRAVFEILRKIPQDGTFDQHAPVIRLAALVGPKGPYFCYDLSAATDRFPASILQVVLGIVISPEFSESWRGFLNSREFRVPKRISERQRVPRNTPATVMYGAGQPMGAYGHWAVFSLGHHLLVQFAYYQAYNKLEWFTHYALLGDDIVIADSKVAELYRILLSALGVEIGIAKSIVSLDTGIIEFAKRLWCVNTDGSLTDLSGISLKEIGAAYADPDVLEGLLTHTNLRSGNLQEACLRVMRLLGIGRGTREASSAPFMKQRPYIKSLMLLITRPGSLYGMESFERWITRIGLSTQGVFSETKSPTVWDTVHQILLARLEKAFSLRTAFLEDHQRPLVIQETETGVKINNLTRLEAAPPHFLRSPVQAGFETFSYQTFLNKWLWVPFLRTVYGEIHEQVKDLYAARSASPLEGYVSLDEMYRSLIRTHGEIARMNTSLNLLYRGDNSEKREIKRRARVRSSVVRLWNKLRPVVLANMTR